MPYRIAKDPFASGHWNPFLEAPIDSHPELDHEAQAATDRKDDCYSRTRHTENTEDLGGQQDRPKTGKPVCLVGLIKLKPRWYSAIIGLVGLGGGHANID